MDSLVSVCLFILFWWCIFLTFFVYLNFQMHKVAKDLFEELDRSLKESEK